MSVHAVKQRGVKNTAPEKRRKKRSKLGKRIWPLIKLTVIGLILISASVWLIGKVSRPFRLYNREERETQQKAAEYQSLKKQNSDLQRKISYIKSPKGVTQAARKLGYVKPGEITLVIPESQKQKK